MKRILYLVALALVACGVAVGWFTFNEELFGSVFFLAITIGYVVYHRKADEKAREKNGIWAIGILVAGVILYVRALHPYFANHMQAVLVQAQAQAAADAEKQHEDRLAWQKAHPAEYAAQLAKARALAGAQRRQEAEAARLAAAASRQAAEVAQQEQAESDRQAAAQQQAASTEAQDFMVGQASELIKGAVVAPDGDNIYVTVDADAWNAFSNQDQTLVLRLLVWKWHAEQVRAGNAGYGGLFLNDLNGTQLVNTQCNDPRVGGCT
jgi:hypothetical protein